MRATKRERLWLRFDRIHARCKWRTGKQLKATDSPRFIDDGLHLSWTLDLRDVRLWCAEAMPVYLIVYLPASETAYWLSVQQEFKNVNLPTNQATTTVRISVNNAVSESVIEIFRQQKLAINQRIAEAIKQ